MFSALLFTPFRICYIAPSTWNVATCRDGRARQKGKIQQICYMKLGYWHLVSVCMRHLHLSILILFSILAVVLECGLWQLQPNDHQLKSLLPTWRYRKSCHRPMSSSSSRTPSNHDLFWPKHWLYPLPNAILRYARLVELPRTVPRPPGPRWIDWTSRPLPTIPCRKSCCG